MPECPLLLPLSVGGIFPAETNGVLDPHLRIWPHPNQHNMDHQLHTSLQTVNGNPCFEDKETALKLLVS